MLEAVVTAGRICIQAVKGCAKRLKKRSREPAPKQDIPKHFHQRVEEVWAALRECGEYQRNTILLLTNGVGLRPSETAALAWANYDSGFRSVAVLRREKPFTLEIPASISPLLAQCRQRCPGATYVFQSRRGTEPSPVGVRSLQYVLSKLVERCELKKKRITLTALRKARPFIPSNTPVGRPRGEEQEDTCAVTAALETAERPWCAGAGRGDDGDTAASCRTRSAVTGGRTGGLTRMSHKPRTAMPYLTVSQAVDVKIRLEVFQHPVARRPTSTPRSAANSQSRCHIRPC